MSQLMSSIGTFMGGTGGKVLNAGLTGAGVLNNFLQGRKQNSYNDAILQNEQNKQAILNDPAKLAEKIAQFRHPLNQGLTAGVGNSVQGYLAERGLSASPAIQEQVMAQAMAPYVNQNENSAMQAALQSLGIPYGGMQPKFQAPVNLTGLLQQLFKTGGASTGTSVSGATSASPTYSPTDNSGTPGGEEGGFTGNGDFDWSQLWNMMPQGDMAGAGAGGF